MCPRGPELMVRWFAGSVKSSIWWVNCHWGPFVFCCCLLGWFIWGEWNVLICDEHKIIEKYCFINKKKLLSNWMEFSNRIEKDFFWFRSWSILNRSRENSENAKRCFGLAKEIPWRKKTFLQAARKLHCGSSECEKNINWNINGWRLTTSPSTLSGANINCQL